MAFPTVFPRQDSSSVVSSNQLTFALTTLFTPPPDCSRPILKPSGNGSNYWVPGSDGGTTTFFGSAWSCYPDQFYLTGDLVPIYSPGACPSGFDIVSAATPLHPAVTYATCCPNYATIFSGYFCTGTTINEVTTVNNGRSTILNGNYLFEYPPITLAWASSDLSKFSPPSAPLLAYKSAVATGASIASSPSQSPGATATKQSATSTGSVATSTTSPPPSGLSTGAKAGIGVGVAVGVLALIGVLIWAILRRRKRRQAQAWPSPNPTAHSGAAASAPAHEERYEKRVNDSDTRWFDYNQPQQGMVHEADASASPWIRSEMSSENVRAELEASEHARQSDLGHTRSLESK